MNDNLNIKPHGNYFVNKCVKVKLDTGEIKTYNCRLPIQLGSVVLVEDNSIEIKGIIIEIMGKQNPMFKNIVRTLKYIAPEDKDIPCLEFVLSKNEDYYSVSKYNETTDVVIIPDSYNGLPVKKIKKDVFANNRYLREIIISKNIEKLEEEAFYSCIKLEKVQFESDSTKISAYSFENCHNLKNIILPSKLKTLEYKVFSGCSSLTDIEIPKSVKTIDNEVFSHCKLLKNVYYDGTIEDWCKITIGYNTSLMDYSENFYLLNDDGDTIYNGKKYKLIDEVISLNKILEIKNFTFKGFKNIKHIKIPYGIKVIGHEVFEDSSIEIIELPDTVEEINSGAFNRCEKLKTIEIPNSVKIIMDRVFDYCESLVDIKFPSSMTKFNCSFIHCVNLRSIELPNNITEINDWMFSGCNNLKSIKIPDGVKHIGSLAFTFCKNLQNVELPQTLEVIEHSAFSYCNELTKVVIPSSVKEISYSVFPKNTLIYYQGTYDDWKLVKKSKDIYQTYVLDENGTEIYDGQRYNRV